jgi:hypothetical protein
MKKFTLLTLALMLGSVFSVQAQSSCSSAQAISVAADASVTVNSTGVTGTAPTQICNTAYYAVADITAGAWYSYTNSGSQDLMVTVTVVPPVATTDYAASFSIFSGSCGSLSCVGGSLITTSDGGQTLNDAEAAFIATAGSTYYIAFDDYYAVAGLGTAAAFDFDVTTNSNIPSAPGVATNPTPADDATNVTIDTSDGNADGTPDNAVAFSWTAPSGTVTEYEFYLSETTAPASVSDMQFLGTTANTSVNLTNMQGNTEYFWAIRPINEIPGNGPDDSQIVIWSFTTQSLGIEDKQLAKIGFYPNPVVNTLQLDIPASVSLESATLHNLLGKQTQVDIQNNSIDMSQMAAGVYILKLETNKGTLTKKVIKQ